MDEHCSSSSSSSAAVDRGATVRQPRFYSPLSNSEPSLRFPRPLGNRRLANWVSSSHPDVMTADPELPPEESGLMSDSAYEVITNTDTESQDDFPAGSVCSSDYLQGDDVQSLVSTEYTGDGDGHRSDAGEGVVLPSQLQEAPAEQSDSDADDTHSDYEDGHTEEHKIEEPSGAWPRESRELGSTAASAATLLQRSSSDDETSRKSSLQYAEESLGTPSASIHTEMEEREKQDTLLAELHSLMDRNMTSLFTAASVVGFLLVFSLTCFVVRFSLTPTSQRDAVIPVPPVEVLTTVSVTTSTIIINHTSTKTVLLSETRTAAPPVATTTETLLLPSSQAQRAPEKPVEEKGVCSAEVYSPQEILLRMPHNTKLYWLAKDSISIELARGAGTIKAKFSSVDEGILIEVPRSDAHGVVNVSVITTRRPKVNETFAVDFGKGVVDEAVDLGRLLVQGFADYFATASVESARRVEEVKAAASEVLKTLEKPISVAGGEATRAWRNYSGLDLPLPNDFVPRAQEQVSRLMRGWDRRAREVEDEVGLSLLRARIGAKALWLRMTGDERAHNLFVSRAAVYVKERAAEAGFRRARRDVEAVREEEGARRGRACMMWGGKRYCVD